MARINVTSYKTRELLQSACLRLLEEHDAADLTASMIAREAGLNRTTLYLHYTDVPQLITVAVDNLLERLNAGGRTLLERNIEPTDEWQETLYRTIAERPKLFLRLFRGPADELLLQRFIETNLAWTHARWEQRGFTENVPEIFLTNQLRLAVYGLIGSTIAWLEDNMPVAPEVVCRWNYEALSELGRGLATRRFRSAVVADDLTESPATTA